MHEVLAAASVLHMNVDPMLSTQQDKVGLAISASCRDKAKRQRLDRYRGLHAATKGLKLEICASTLQSIHEAVRKRQGSICVV